MIETIVISVCAVLLAVIISECSFRRNQEDLLKLQEQVLQQMVFLHNRCCYMELKLKNLDIKKAGNPAPKPRSKTSRKRT